MMKCSFSFSFVVLFFLFEIFTSLAKETIPKCGKKGASKKEAADGNHTIFDYIVVGAGAGGGVVASRLAQAGFLTLLLDAGPDYQGDLTEVPLFWPLATNEPQLEWAFRSINSPADPGRDNVLYPRGSMIGGSTRHNAMVGMYSFPKFWDGLKDVTGDGEFDEDKMRKRFEKVEKNEYDGVSELLSNQEGHGYRGYTSVSFPDTALGLSPGFFDIQLIRTFVRFTLQTLPENSFLNFFTNIFKFPFNLPIILDANAPGANEVEGPHLTPATISPKNGYVRSGVYDLIKETERKFDTLVIKPNSFVTKILLDDDNNAIGVDVTEGKSLYGASTDTPSDNVTETAYFANKEIILSAGSFNTPQLLMLSGIGPSSHLSDFGIETLVELPGVGSNLRDKLEATLNWQATQKWKALTQGCSNRKPTPEDDKCLQDFLKQKFPSPYTSNGAIAASQLKSMGKSKHPDIYIQPATAIFVGYEDGWVDNIFDTKDGFSINLSTIQYGPTTGSVRLNSTDPFDTPIIDFGGYDDEDLERVAKFAKEISDELGSDLLDSGILKKLINPDDSVRSKTDFKLWVRRRGWGHHPLGTCKMGPDNDDMTVVNGQFQVRGVGNLRIVDASVLPDQPGFFPTIPIYMMSEKAAEDIIKANLTATTTQC